MKIYDNPEKINIDELPDKFVLKTNHGSGFNIIVKNKNEFDAKNAKNTLSNWLKIDYGNRTKEFHYSFIKRKVFAEEYMGNKVIDYKFFCYNGVPKYFYAHQIIHSIEYNTYFDINWNKLDINCGYPNIPKPVHRPKYFDLMKKYASKLSSPFIFVRVDLYEINDEIRLGEMTYAPDNGGLSCKSKNGTIFDFGQDIKIF